MIHSVIIIDDDEADRYIAARVLRKAGLEADIHEYADGQSALDFITQIGKTQQPGKPHFRPSTLALVDINMPRLNGFEFLEQLEAGIRKGDLHADWIAVMMFTSSANQRDRDKAKSFSIVRGYIVKPLTVADVQTLIERANHSSPNS